MTISGSPEQLSDALGESVSLLDLKDLQIAQQQETITLQANRLWELEYAKQDYQRAVNVLTEDLAMAKSCMAALDDTCESLRDVIKRLAQQVKP